MSVYDYYITPEEYEEAARNGIDAFNLERRVRLLGWPKAKAINTPLRKITDRTKWRRIAEQNGINYNTFISRIRRGWDEELAATKPLQSQEEVKEQAMKATEKIRKIPKEYIQLAAQNGIPYATLHSRVRKGWDLYRAATQPLATHSEAGRAGARRVRELYGDWNRFSFNRHRIKGGEQIDHHMA